MTEQSSLNYIRSRYLGTGQESHFGLGEELSADKKEEIARMAVRADGIVHSTVRTITENMQELDRAKALIGQWIEQKEIVRVLGAGRALIAASLAGNRLAHAGALVSFMGGTVPMPNSSFGGGIISASASGRTKTVLEAMEVAKNKNPNIQIIGIASAEADDFHDMCDVFIGIYSRDIEVANPLSALADVEELIIAEILDALIVMAGQSIGFDDEGWRRGHEDIGPTGPYAPKNT